MANEREVRNDGIGGYVSDNPLTNVATTLTADGLAALEAIDATEFAWIILDPYGEAGAPEHVKVTAHTAAATTATILRAQNGTTARQHNAGTKWIHGPVASADFRPLLLHVRDEKASGTNGGTFTSGAWQKRTLNTVVTNELGTGLTADEITGLVAGTYEVEALAPAHAVNGHQARLYDVTGAVVLVLGSNEYANTAGNAITKSVVRGRFTLTATSTVRLEHRCATTSGGTYGFGQANSFGTEVYAGLQIRKVS